MKAIVLHGKENIRLEDFPLADLKPNEVRISVAYCGICGSDFHKYAGKENTHPIHYPIPLGHEISGYVAAVGKEVTRFQIGDRVTVDPNHSCGKCRYCQAGKPSFCESAHGVVKGMAEYVTSPEENVYPIPAKLNLRDAALAEPLSCCLHGMDLLNVQQGETVALIGFGAIGSIMLQLIRNAGAGEIIIIEADESKRNAAMECGATVFLSASDQEALNGLSKKYSIQKVMECVGIAAAQHTALCVADKGATIVFFGVSDASETIPFSIYNAFSKELTIKASFVNPHTTQRAIQLLATGRLNTKKIIHSDISMEEAVDEIRQPKLSRSGKILVRIHPAAN